MPLDDSGEQDLLAATQGQTRRVRPEFVNYAKRAKRVDVRRLKENIWKGLDIVVPKKKAEDGDESAVRHPRFTSELHSFIKINNSNCFVLFCFPGRRRR